MFFNVSNQLALLFKYSFSNFWGLKELRPTNWKSSSSYMISNHSILACKKFVFQKSIGDMPEMMWEAFFEIVENKYNSDLSSRTLYDFYSAAERKWNSLEIQQNRKRASKLPLSCQKPSRSQNTPKVQQRCGTNATNSKLDTLLSQSPKVCSQYCTRKAWDC